MEVIRLGEFNPKALEERIVIQPLECALNVANNKRNNFACLKRLDYLLGYFKKTHQNSLQKYVENLKTKLLQLTKEELFDSFNFKLQEILNETNDLKNFPELARASLTFNLQLLRISDNINWINDSVEVKQSDYIRSYLIPNYYYLETLIETLGKKQAINLFKRYLSSFLDKQASQLAINFTTLTDTFNSRKKSIGIPSDWVVVIGLKSESKYIFRNDNCLWIDTLKDLPDKEIKYFICCYGDYQIANTTSNGHVILTMEHTIAQGDPYCSRVKHDTRYDWNLDHPDKEVFDGLWSISK